jgi:hypothetical protein
MLSKRLGAWHVGDEDEAGIEDRRGMATSLLYCLFWARETKLQAHVYIGILIQKHNLPPMKEGQIVMLLRTANTLTPLIHYIPNVEPKKKISYKPMPKEK